MSMSGSLAVATAVPVTAAPLGLIIAALVKGDRADHAWAFLQSSPLLIALFMLVFSFGAGLTLLARKSAMKIYDDLYPDKCE
ncbi:hypothetical protein [Xanthomonas pisi]|uniref:Uncharacterized protein n=1 Tax=Xanthomonas pisi TaxID=56457 RepID=A0A2S7D8Y3_9XANT|nr:hypothetical protein [Xanthomonas pisi]PPU70288.1 hypothetical protein XpiCFBP4643_01655 [Xanthomonas pisi]